MSPSVRSIARRTTSAVASSCSRPASGSSSVTSISVRMIASGVRSSCDALATNSRCASNAVCRRSSIASNWSARSLSSSGGPARSMRSSSRSSVMRRAVSAISCTGRSIRPATNQPSPTDATAITPSAMLDRQRISRSVSSLMPATMVSNSVEAWTAKNTPRRPRSGSRWTRNVNSPCRSPGPRSRRSSSASRRSSPPEGKLRATSAKLSASRTVPASRNNAPYQRVSRSRIDGCPVAPRSRRIRGCGSRRRARSRSAAAHPGSCAAS